MPRTVPTAASRGAIASVVSARVLQLDPQLVLDELGLDAVLGADAGYGPQLAVGQAVQFDFVRHQRRLDPKGRHRRSLAAPSAVRA